MDNNGIISGCSQCTLGPRRCCDFGQNNFIVPLPGELQAAEAANPGSTAHLRRIAIDINGIERVVCEAKNSANCDGGYKPWDCLWYPLWPQEAGPGGIVTAVIKGAKCPLSMEKIKPHLDYVEETVAELTKRDPALPAFLSKVQMHGYTAPMRPISIRNGVIEVRTAAA